MNIKTLVVAPHPDDEVLGCGGVMARHAARGDEVHVVVMSRGAPEIFPPEQVERTRTELREAHGILGVTGATFLDFPAPKLDAVPGHELADGIAKVIRAVQPTIVYLPHRGDLHADHQVVYLAGLVAARPIDGCSVKKILCYETLSETEWASPHGDAAFIPTVFADITDHLKTKIEALSCIRSQIKEPPHSRSLEVIEALARFRGGTVGLTAAEAFALVREIG
ncbi:MAG: PIG-L deacetylase family protein [Armatimonadota bacterium]|nr:PIG-L deacetylase family protein [Armatimonadota bacterium]